MHDTVQRAKEYRERAEELRTIAQDWMDPETQQSLLKVAIDYERMADSLERAARSQELHNTCH